MYNTAFYDIPKIGVPIGLKFPVLVTEDMVRGMKKGAVIIDVSIDMGGCVETSEVTSHENPIFVKHDVVPIRIMLCTNTPSR